MERWIEETLHPHWRVSLKASRVLHEEKTAHQHLVILDNETFGRVLVLDGVIQLSTRDEFVYHEMMAHVPMMAHAAPQHVLIVGGGDGGVMREVLRHPSVEKVTLCEIDASVVNFSLKHFPEVAGGAFDDARSEVVIADGTKFMAETERTFDAIIVDSSEPEGPSAVLFTEQFFADCRQRLRPGGVLINQNGHPFFNPGHIQATTRIQRKLFKDPACYACIQPSYFSGHFALCWSSDEPALRQVETATLAARHRERGSFATRYYSPEMHQAAFVLPMYVRQAMETGNF